MQPLSHTQLAAPDVIMLRRGCEKLCDIFSPPRISTLRGKIAPLPGKKNITRFSTPPCNLRCRVSHSRMHSFSQPVYFFSHQLYYFSQAMHRFSQAVHFFHTRCIVFHGRCEKLFHTTSVKNVAVGKTVPLKINFVYLPSPNVKKDWAGQVPDLKARGRARPKYAWLGPGRAQI